MTESDNDIIPRYIYEQYSEYKKEFNQDAEKCAYNPELYEAIAECLKELLCREYIRNKNECEFPYIEKFENSEITLEETIANIKEEMKWDMPRHSLTTKVLQDYDLEPSEMFIFWSILSRAILEKGLSTRIDVTRTKNSSIMIVEKFQEGEFFGFLT